MSADKPAHAVPLSPPCHPLANLTFFASTTHDCAYLDGQSAVTVFANPEAPMNMSTYSALAEIGFRRSGSHVYTPHCPACQACVPTRLPVASFKPNRNQRRTLNRAADFSINIEEAVFNNEAFALYQKYISHRHAGGSMDDSDPEKYLEFLSCDWSHTEFVQFRWQGQLIAVAVQDVLTRGLSSVYTFFDPDFSAISPGRYALLWQIAEARRRKLPWLFLGYWIGDCQKMLYKQEYRPIELFRKGGWQRYDRAQPLPLL
ncbi:MAG: arginyltransferase [Gammaproteobacteria bacterium]|nr:arginyltransferase [Gammaproteobacteria bacterium]